VPLSEHEQRQFDEIERALYSDDPKFASKLRVSDPRKAGRRTFVSGVAIVVLGVGVLVAGAILPNWYVGVLGFLIMLAAATRAYAGFKRWTGMASAPARNADGTLAFTRPRRTRRSRGPRTPGAGRTSFREMLEERWRRREERGGF